MKKYTICVFICIFLLILVFNVSGITYTDIKIGYKMPLENDKSIILKEISENQETLWYIVDKNNNVLQEFGKISPGVSSFSYKNNFFMVGNIFSPGRWVTDPEGKVESLKINNIVDLKPTMTITKEETIACGSNYINFVSNNNPWADYNAVIRKFSENTYNTNYENTYRSEVLAGTIIIYENGTSGLRHPGANHINQLSLQEINDKYDFFCGGGYKAIGGVQGIYYDIKIVDLTQNSITFEFTGCNNDGVCDADFKENRTSCPNDCPTICGDGICDISETTQENYCCEDCGCSNDLVCVNNVCVDKEASDEDISEKIVVEFDDNNYLTQDEQELSFIQKIVSWFKRVFGGL